MAVAAPQSYARRFANSSMPFVRCIKTCSRPENWGEFMVTYNHVNRYHLKKHAALFLYILRRPTSTRAVDPAMAAPLHFAADQA